MQPCNRLITSAGYITTTVSHRVSLEKEGARLDPCKDTIGPGNGHAAVFLLECPDGALQGRRFACGCDRLAGGQAPK